jgi:hypothetical protein
VQQSFEKNEYQSLMKGGVIASNSKFIVRRVIVF